MAAQLWRLNRRPLTHEPVTAGLWGNALCVVREQCLVHMLTMWGGGHLRIHLSYERQIPGSYPVALGSYLDTNPDRGLGVPLHHSLALHVNPFNKPVPCGSVVEHSKCTAPDASDVTVVYYFRYQSNMHRNSRTNVAIVELNMVSRV